MKRLAVSLSALLVLACGYQRLDRLPRTSAWMAKGETVRIATFKNSTAKLGAEETFRTAMEHRIMAASPWKLVPQSAQSRWVIQVTLERYELRPLGLSMGNAAKGSAGSASRVEVLVTGSVQLLDGQTGDVVVSRPHLTFSNQYRVDQNFASFGNQELRVLLPLADDFAESFLTQLLEGSN